MPSLLTAAGTQEAGISLEPTVALAVEAVVLGFLGLHHHQQVVDQAIHQQQAPPKAITEERVQILEVEVGAQAQLAVLFHLRLRKMVQMVATGLQVLCRVLL